MLLQFGVAGQQQRGSPRAAQRFAEGIVFFKKTELAFAGLIESGCTLEFRVSGEMAFGSVGTAEALQ